ncbi:MAG: winged helix-turn-helix transcriptional regulator [Solirubrobacterales bacterium]|nr:winged helix-turn-helix transcriptional regulator [Solirubrobacterales bacterium]
MPEGPPPLALHEALAQHTGFLISRVGLRAQRAFAERIGEVGLTPRGWGALNVLDEEGAVTQQWLGRCIGMDPSSMVATIDELEAQGLVERRRNPQDRRAHALHITAKGRRTLTRGRKIARRAQEELLAPLKAEERRQLHDLLLRVAQDAGPAQAQASAATSSERVPTG